MEKYLTLLPLTGLKKGYPGDTFQCLAERLVNSGEKGRIRFSIRDKEEHLFWHLVLDGQSCRAHQEPMEKLDLEIVTPLDTWRKIAEGKLSPLVAVAKGRMRIRGDEKLGKRLLKRLSTGEGKSEICD
jgi:putative sterol carrier protein